jgi:arylsulfate sulfotransferase
MRTSRFVSSAVVLLIVGCSDDILPPVPQLVPIADLVEGELSVTPDPSGRAPLVAEATFTTIQPVTVSLTVLGEEPLTHEITVPATQHAIPILGLYPGVENLVELRLTNGTRTHAVDTLRISTDPLPDVLPDIEILTADPSRMEPGWSLSSLNVGNAGTFIAWPIMFDTNGDIRWYLDLTSFNDVVFLVEPLANGNILFGQGEALYEYDRLGREVSKWQTPGYVFHHDVVEKPDGNFIIAVDKRGTGTVEDHAIEIDRNTGAIVTEWDLRQALDVDRFAFLRNPVDWFHMNSVWYSAEDDAVIFSGRNQSSVVKVTRGNEVVWILGAHRGWGTAGLEGNGADLTDYLLVAVDADGNPFPQSQQDGDEGSADFRWPWGQHAAMVLPNGNIFLFDNGFLRNFNTESPTFSRGVEYEVDETQRTVRQTWQFGEERGAVFYSSIISDVDFLPTTGNRLIMPGIVEQPDARAFVTEVAYPSGDVVFEAAIRFRNRLGSGEIQWGNFDMVYRSERMTPYPQ